MGKKTLEEKYLKYNPEEDPNGAQGIELADQIIEKYGSIENIPKIVNKGDEEVKSLEKKNELEKMILFIKRTNEFGVNPDNMFTERDTKEKLIREYKGNKKYLSDFSDHRIGSIFNGLYYSILKKSKK